MSKGPFVAGANRRFLVPSLSQELSSDDLDTSDSSESSDEHSSPTQTTISSTSATSSPSNLPSERSGTSEPVGKTKPDLLYKAEAFQVRPNIFFNHQALKCKLWVQGQR